MCSTNVKLFGVCTCMCMSGIFALKVNVELAQLSSPSIQSKGAETTPQKQRNRTLKAIGVHSEQLLGLRHAGQDTNNETIPESTNTSIQLRAIEAHSGQLLGLRQAGQDTSNETMPDNTNSDEAHTGKAKELPRLGNNKSAQVFDSQPLPRPGSNKSAQVWDAQPLPRLGGNKSAQVLDAQPLLSFQIQGKLAAPTLAFAAEIGAIVICILLLACMLSWIMDSSGHDRAFELVDTPKQSKNDSPQTQRSSPQSVSSKSIGQSPSSVGPSLPRTRDDLVDAIDGHDGTWARNYRGADGKYRDALELLYRCGIIPPQEFAVSRVRQDHIEECVWIATYMLRQRPLVEWVQVWPEAQAKFEESVLACFTARTDVLDTHIVKDEAPFVSPGASSLPKAGVRPSQKIAEDLVLRSRDSTGQNLLIMRCREIMAKNKMQHQPLMAQGTAFDMAQGSAFEELMTWRPDTDSRSPTSAGTAYSPALQDISTPMQTVMTPLHQTLGHNLHSDESGMLSKTPRVSLGVFEEVVPSPVSDVMQPPSIRTISNCPQVETMRPVGSSAACSTSAYHTMNATER